MQKNCAILANSSHKMVQSGAQRAETAEVAAVGGDGVVIFGGFEQLGHVREAVVEQEVAKWLIAEGAEPDVGVTVPAAGALAEGIVEVKEADPLAADGVVEAGDHVVVSITEVVARDPDVTGIEAHTDATSQSGGNAVDELGELLEAGAEHATRAGRSLEQHVDTGHGFKRLLHGFGVAHDSGSDIAIGCMSGVRDDGADAERVAAGELALKSINGAEAQRGVG